MKKLSYIITQNSITILIGNKPEIVDSTHPNFERVENCIKNGCSEEEILNLMNVSKAVVGFGEGKVQVKDGEIIFNDKAVHSALSTRILSLMEQGFDITPFTNFMENLYKNPSKRAVDETYGFLEACNLPITEDGCFLAYKKIKDDYTDCYTGTIDNSIGAKPRMERYEVDENSEVTCSQGLHVASYSYMSHYSGDRIVICKVNPKDVVAVPADYNNSKMRVCEYEVINEVAVREEEITSNVIRDKDAYSDVYDFSVDFSDDVSTSYIEDLSTDTDVISLNSLDEDYDTCFSEGSTTLTDVANYLDVENIVMSESLYELRETFREDVDASMFLEGITNSTSFWKRDLLNILTDSDKTETKKEKFGDKLTKYLETYDEDRWNELQFFLESENIYLNGLMLTSFTLAHCEPLVKRLKKYAKEKRISKKSLLNFLGI